MKIDNDFNKDASSLEGYNDVVKYEIPEGFITYKEWEDRYGKFIEWRKIWINEDKRQQGFGSKLIKEMIKIAKKKKLDLYVRASTKGEDILGKFLLATGHKTIYKISDWDNCDKSWLGDPIKFNSEKDHYRNTILGITYVVN